MPPHGEVLEQHGELFIVDPIKVVIRTGGVVPIEVRDRNGRRGARPVIVLRVVDRLRKEEREEEGRGERVRADRRARSN